MSIASFIHQKSYEKIIYKVRKDTVILVPTVFTFLILLIVPFGAFFLLNEIFPGFLDKQPLYLLSVLSFSSYYLLVGLIYYTNFINYYLDILVLTNDRLLHIEQKGIFARKISEVDLYRIQDITSTVDGVFQSFFNFGDLLVQTAGATEQFIIRNVPDPETLRHKILLLVEEDRKFHAANVTMNIKTASK